MNQNEESVEPSENENAVSRLDSILSSVTSNVVEMNFDIHAQENERSEIISEITSNLGKYHKIPPRRVLFTTQYNIGTVKLVASKEKLERRAKNNAKYIQDGSKYSKKAKAILERHERRERKNR